MNTAATRWLETWPGRDEELDCCGVRRVGAGHSAVTSATADLDEDSSTIALLAA